MTPGRTFVRRRGTTPIPNATVHDPRLSYAALGLLTVILARPETAPQGYRALQGRGLGKDATLGALRELTDAGYRHQVTRSGGRGALVTDTVISEEPISREQAEDWLMRSPGLPGVRARNSAARTDQAEHSVTAGQYVRGVSEPDPSEPDGPAHRTTSSKVTSSLRSESPERPTANVRVECPHGMPDGLNLTRAGRPRCALCRRGLTPGVAPWDAETPVLFDPAQRAAGEHLEQAS